MAEGIESSDDLKRQMEDLELNAPDLPGVPESTAGATTGIPPWVKYVIVADIITIAVVLIFVFVVI